MADTKRWPDDALEARMIEVAGGADTDVGCHVRALLARVRELEAETARQRKVLEKIADPDLAGKTWDQVKRDQRFNPNEPVEFWSWSAAMYAQWGYANMARIVLSGVPEDCPVCGGSGGRAGRGECPACDGTGRIGAEGGGP